MPASSSLGSFHFISSLWLDVRRPPVGIISEKDLPCYPQWPNESAMYTYRTAGRTWPSFAANHYRYLNVFPCQIDSWRRRFVPTVRGDYLAGWLKKVGIRLAAFTRTCPLLFRSRLALPCLTIAFSSQPGPKPMTSFWRVNIFSANRNFLTQACLARSNATKLIYPALFVPFFLTRPLG